MTRRANQYRFLTLVAVLVLLQFTLRPWLGSPLWAPDFLLLALMLYAIRARPGRAAVAGFTVGLVTDSLVEAAFGAGALAHTVVGYLQAWGKAVFFPDNLAVNLSFFLVGAWVRDLMVLLAGGQTDPAALAWQLGTWSLLRAVTTTFTGAIILILFRDWLTSGVNP